MRRVPVSERGWVSPCGPSLESWACNPEILNLSGAPGSSRVQVPRTTPPHTGTPTPRFRLFQPGLAADSYFSHTIHWVASFVINASYKAWIWALRSRKQAGDFLKGEWWAQTPSGCTGWGPAYLLKLAVQPPGQRPSSILLVVSCLPVERKFLA